MLQLLRAEYVILLLEDFLLTAAVDTARVRGLVDLARDRNVGCLRLVPYQPPFDLAGEPIPGLPGLRKVAAGHPYRVSAQAAIWRSDVLERHLMPGANAWEFELLGSALSEEFPDEFWEVSEPVLQYEHGVEKGRWKPRGLAICADAGVTVDLEARPQFSTDELHRHLAMAAEGVARFARYQSALALFRRGERLRGAATALRGIAADPFAAKMWGILAFGLLGRRPLAWLELINRRRKLRKWRRRLNRGATSGAL